MISTGVNVALTQIPSIVHPRFDHSVHTPNAANNPLVTACIKALPADVNVLIVADRGFGDQKLYRFLTEELKFDYLIRFRAISR
jgi:hypothetical protein